MLSTVRAPLIGLLWNLRRMLPPRGRLDDVMAARVGLLNVVWRGRRQTLMRVIEQAVTNSGQSVPTRGKSTGERAQCRPEV